MMGHPGVPRRRLSQPASQPAVRLRLPVTFNRKFTTNLHQRTSQSAQSPAGDCGNHQQGEQLQMTKKRKERERERKREGGSQGYSKNTYGYSLQ